MEKQFRLIILCVSINEKVIYQVRDSIAKKLDGKGDHIKKEDDLSGEVIVPTDI